MLNLTAAPSSGVPSWNVMPGGSSASTRCSRRSARPTRRGTPRRAVRVLGEQRIADRLEDRPATRRTRRSIRRPRVGRICLQAIHEGAALHGLPVVSRPHALRSRWWARFRRRTARSSPSPPTARGRAGRDCGRHLGGLTAIIVVVAACGDGDQCEDRQRGKHGRSSLVALREPPPARSGDGAGDWLRAGPPIAAYYADGRRRGACSSTDGHASSTSAHWSCLSGSSPHRQPACSCRWWHRALHDGTVHTRLCRRPRRSRCRPRRPSPRGRGAARPVERPHGRRRRCPRAHGARRRLRRRAAARPAVPPQPTPATARWRGPKPSTPPRRVHRRGRRHLTVRLAARRPQAQRAVRPGVLRRRRRGPAHRPAPQPRCRRAPGAVHDGVLPPPDELAAEAAASGLDDVCLFAVEGPAWLVEDVDEVATQAAAARAVETEASLMAATSHMLVIGTRRDPDRLVATRSAARFGMLTVRDRQLARGSRVIALVNVAPEADAASRPRGRGARAGAPGLHGGPGAPDGPAARRARLASPASRRCSTSSSPSTPREPVCYERTYGVRHGEHVERRHPGLHRGIVDGDRPHLVRGVAFDDAQAPRAGGIEDRPEDEPRGHAPRVPPSRRSAAP